MDVPRGSGSVHLAGLLVCTSAAILISKMGKKRAHTQGSVPQLPVESDSLSWRDVAEF